MGGTQCTSWGGGDIEIMNFMSKSRIVKMLLPHKACPSSGIFEHPWTCLGIVEFEVWAVWLSLALSTSASDCDIMSRRPRLTNPTTNLHVLETQSRYACPRP